MGVQAQNKVDPTLSINRKLKNLILDDVIELLSHKGVTRMALITGKILVGEADSVPFDRGLGRFHLSVTSNATISILTFIILSPCVEVTVEQSARSRFAGSKGL